MLSFIKSFLFVVRKFWLATVLNLLGLSVAYCTFYFLTTQIEFSSEYNTQVPNYERCYRLENHGVISDDDWIDWCTYDMKVHADTIPEVEQAVAFTTYSNSYEVYGKNGLEIWQATQYEGDIFGFFGVELLCGQTDSITPGKDLIISRKKALECFGELNVAGRTVEANGTERTIAAVVENLHDNYLLKGEVFDPYLFKGNYQHSFNATVALRLLPGVSPETVESAYSPYLSKIFYTTGYNDLAIRLSPFSETYFSQVNTGFDQGSHITTLILRLSALLLLLLAGINFANFSLAQAPTRVNSINMRKILGSSNMALRLQMIMENVAVSLLALGVALLVIFFVADSGYTQTFLLGSVALGSHIPLLFKLLGISVLLGLISGIYPAWFATSFQPSVAIKGSFGLSPKGKRMRSALMLVQFAISIFMFIYLSLIVQQGKFVLGSEYGYCKNSLLFASLSQKPASEFSKINDELPQVPGVESVAFSQFLIGNDNHREIMTYMMDDSTKIMFTILRVSYNYLKTYGIDIMEGRDFQPSDTEAYIINETMAAQMKGDFPGTMEIFGYNVNVVGISSNPRLHSMRNNGYIDNVVFQYSCLDSAELFLQTVPDDRYYLKNQIATIRIGGVDMETAKRNVEEYFRKNFPDENVEVNYFDHSLIMLYDPELRFGRQMVASTVIADIIMLIGVACLTMFEVQYRRKEIGIRKVLGSSNWQILMLLSKRYVWLLLIAFAVSAPLAYIIGNSWLSTFAEHVDISPLPFVVGFLGVSADALGITALCAISSLRGNLINCIKTE